jgi:hypothetical protein
MERGPSAAGVPLGKDVGFPIGNNYQNNYAVQNLVRLSFKNVSRKLA